MKRTKENLLSGVTKEIQHSKFVGSNTLHIFYTDGSEAIRLHDTDVITKKDGIITLDSGGWRTRTTKERINDYLVGWGGLHVWQENGVWYVGGSGFYDGMQISGGKVLKPKEANIKEAKKMKRQIKDFTSMINRDNLPFPDAGDCWLCSLKTEEGKTMGDISGDNGHLLSHVKEKYLHGSLLVNAMRDSGYNDAQIGTHYHLKVADAFKRALRRYLQKRLIPDIAVK